MNLGTFATDDGFAYDWRQNPLMAQGLMRTTGAPFGRPVSQPIALNTEYATVAAASAFAAVLASRGGHGIAPAVENATFVTESNGVIAPKWEILFPETDRMSARRVNAGVLATILGDDPDYGSNIGAKAGKIAEAIGETFDRDVHVPLTKALLAAAQAVA